MVSHYNETINADEIYSGIANGRVLTKQLSTQILGLKNCIFILMREEKS